MCLAVPSKIVQLEEDRKLAVADTMGVKRTISIELLPEPVEIGDYVIVHVGYAISKLNEKEALESLRYFEELLAEEENA